jgi:hypothetical protein
MLRIDAQKLNTHSRFLFSMTPLPGASLPLMLVHVRLPLSPQPPHLLPAALLSLTISLAPAAISTSSTTPLDRQVYFGEN